MHKTIRRVLLIICDTDWMKAHLARGWRMTGADVSVEHFGTTMGRGWDEAGEQEHRARNERWRRVASEIAARGGLDLVFLVALDDVLENETLAHFKALGAKLVLYQTDMLAQWYKVIRIIRFMDLVCYGSKDHVEFYRRRRIPLHDFGFAAVPPTDEEWNASPIPYEGILFTGSPWPYRQSVLQQIATAGLPLRIYGHSWNRKGSWPSTPGKWRKAAHDVRWYLLPRLREEGPELLRSLSRKFLPAKPAVRADKFAPGVIHGDYAGAQFVPLVRGAAINLGFTQMLLDITREYPRMIRLRDFEIPIAGGFYLTQNCPDLGKYYEVGREVAVWDTAQDVVERCRYYLARPEERAQIAQAGRRRALDNHTWLHRFAGMAARLDMQLPCDAKAPHPAQ
jgi:hypothetical protein